MMYYKSVSLIFIIFSIGFCQLEARSRLKATLDFNYSAHNITQSLHSPRIYYCGKIISAYQHGTSKITFDIPKNNNQNRFYILVVEEVGSKKYKNDVDELDEDDYQNTIEHLYVKQGDSYKFFVLDLVADEQDIRDQSIEALVKAEEKTYHWKINEELLPEDGNIPDSAIIIYYFPEMFKEIKGGSLLDLPTMYFSNEKLIHNDIAEMNDALNKLQLAAIDTDTIHAPTKRKIATQNNRLLILDLA